MDFQHSPRVADLADRLGRFMAEHVTPNENLWDEQLANAANRWAPVPLVETLKARARAVGLWNLFSAHPEHGGPGLDNLEYAPLAEIMGRTHWASQVFNCSAPDTGNMEVLHRYGTPEQKARWLEPLLTGEIRSAFCMSEPGIASSDATNICTRITRHGDHYIINGRKWWSSGAASTASKLLIVMGQTDPDAPERHKCQSQILIPMDTPGVRIVRNLTLFGYDDAPHGHAELAFDDVRVPVENMLLGEGCGFAIAQGRLGPGRIHHCMRNIGQAERVLEKMCRRALERHTFGKALADRTVTQERIAEARILIDQTRLLVLNAADRMDRVGSKGARVEIGLIKVAAPAMLCKVVDWAIQLFGAAGVTDDFGLGFAYARARVMRFVDGPDEVHRNQIAKAELAKYRAPRAPRTASAL
jgi:acyl-CoA dehydrogenase